MHENRDGKSAEEKGAQPDGDGQLQSTAGDGHLENHDPAATAAPQSSRDARQFYQPFVAYQPYPQRRAFKGPVVQLKKKPMRTKQGRRPRPPRRRPAVGPTAQAVPMQAMGRYRRLPPPMRAQQVNYIDSAGADYDDGFESAPMTSVDYGEFDHEAYVFGQAGQMQQISGGGGGGGQMIASSGRSRKRPVAYAPEEPQAVVHVPVRVQARPLAALYPTPASAPATTTDPMEKLRQLVHEAMDEHFANRHQGLYADRFDKQPHHPVQYSAKYKRQQDKDKDKEFRQSQSLHQSSSRTTTDATKPETPVKKEVQGSYASLQHHSSGDAEADGSDDRLTLAEISAYMGAKPAETVLSAGGHRYVLSDALQQSYRQQQQQQQPQQQYSGEDQRDHQQQYLRYVSPFEAVYELPVVPRWMYK